MTGQRLEAGNLYLAGSVDLCGGEKRSTMTTKRQITEFIDRWLAENRSWVSDVSVDFALDVRLMIDELGASDLTESEVPEPVGV